MNSQPRVQDILKPHRAADVIADTLIKEIRDGLIALNDMLQIGRAHV